MSKPFLYDYQMDAVKKMRNGCILNGGVGSGKSRTGLYYYFKEQGGSIDPDYIPMKNPKDLYIITTAMKRDSLEWEGELAHYLISTNPELSLYNNKVVIDGSFDINIWYSYDNDKKTSVATKNIHYTETVLVNLKNSTSLDGSDIIVRVLKEPSCSNVKIKDDVIEFDIEKELGIEVINDTKVKIAALEDEDAWENLNDEEDNVSDIKEEKEDQTKEDTVMENIDNEVKEDFI